MQSTYITFIKVCKYHGIPTTEWKLNGQYNFIEFKNGGRIDLLDLKMLPSDPLYERFGSTEYSDGAIEEAGEVHYLAKDVLKSRIGRHLNKELGIIANLLSSGNPKKNWTKTEYYIPWIKGKKMPPEFRKAIGDRKRGKGSKRYNWNYKEWRRHVLERDCYKCMMCGTVNDLTVHHIIPWKDNKN